jgi:hypothetical protein
MWAIKIKKKKPRDWSSYQIYLNESYPHQWGV